MQFRRPPIHSLLATLLLLVVAAFVGFAAVLSAIESDYSHRFGYLTQLEFAAINHRLDRLRQCLRASLVMGTVIDVAVLVSAIRALAKNQRAGAVLLFAVVIGLFIGFVWLLAAMPFAPMIG